MKTATTLLLTVLFVSLGALAIEPLFNPDALTVNVWNMGEGIQIAGIGAMMVAKGQQEALQAAVAKFKADFPEKPLPIMVPSYLRVDVALKTGKNLYNFNVEQNDSLDSDVERKLDQNDEFIMTHLGIYILEQDDDEVGKGVLQTYPNAAAFAGMPAGDVGDLETVYQGELSIKVGNVVFLPNFTTNLFRVVPQTQQGTVTSSFVNAAAADVISTQPNSEIESTDGLFPIRPTIRISGQGSNEIQVVLPNFTGAVLTNPAAGFTNIISFRPIGLIIKNAATR